jgi:hypothetical protein
MAELRLQEAAMLKQFLDDPEGQVVLRAFFTSEAQRSTAAAVRALLNYDEKQALEQAFYANAFQEGFGRLQQFAKEQMLKASA